MGLELEIARIMQRVGGEQSLGEGWITVAQSDCDERQRDRRPLGRCRKRAQSKAQRLGWNLALWVGKKCEQAQTERIAVAGGDKHAVQQGTALQLLSQIAHRFDVRQGGNKIRLQFLVARGT